MNRGLRRPEYISDVPTRKPLALIAAGVTALLVIVTLFAMTQPMTRAAPSAPPFLGSVASPEVHTAIQLSDPYAHPRQLAYDPGRDGLWFWTSIPHHDGSIDNTVSFYDIGLQQLRSWPIYSGDWSSQLLAGLAVAPNGDVWIGWNHNLVDFQPATGQYTRYPLPAHPAYPLPAAVLGNRPDDLGIADLAAAPDGTIWIARYGALSLTAFSPHDQSFHEIPLPTNAGDPAKLAIAAATGEVFFTTNLSADHPDHGAEKVGVYDPATGATQIVAKPALALAVTPGGDLVTVFRGAQFGISRLRAAERANARALKRAPVFEHLPAPFDVDDAAIAIDPRGRIWAAVGGKPEMAVLDPVGGGIHRYQYAAPAVEGHALPFAPNGPRTAPAPAGAVWLVHIVAMAADSQGHLWYIRAGYNSIEEVSA